MKKKMFLVQPSLANFLTPKPKSDFLHIFHKCITKARMDRFFSKFIRLFQKTFLDTSAKISTLPFKMRSAVTFPDWCPKLKICKNVNDGFNVIKG